MKTNVENCARCGQDHPDIEIKPLTNPVMSDDIEIANYFVMCPTLNEPILIHVTSSGKIYGGNQ